MPKPPRALAALPLAGAIALAGCTQMEVEQGNYLTQQQVGQVEEGMGREAVRRALGKPLIRDPFRPDRWDYVFTRTSREGEQTRRRLTVFFDDAGNVARLVTEEGPFPEGYSPVDGAS
jgi:outer membrane protein assembly factor BamE